MNSTAITEDRSAIGDSFEKKDTVNLETEGVRFYYMNALRSIAMLAGIFLHAGLAYSVMLNQFVIANTTASHVADFFIWLIHTFRMPLFFVIAGFFAHVFSVRSSLGY